MKCKACGAEMEVIDAHFDSECSQQLMDYECPACHEDSYSEVCGEFEQPDPGEDHDYSDGFDHENGDEDGYGNWIPADG